MFEAAVQTDEPGSDFRVEAALTQSKISARIAADSAVSCYAPAIRKHVLRISYLAFTFCAKPRRSERADILRNCTTGQMNIQIFSYALDGKVMWSSCTLKSNYFNNIVVEFTFYCSFHRINNA